MTKKINVILMSAISILLCTILLVTGSYALFSDEVIISNHLQAGTLEATLTRVSVDAKKLNDNGIPEKATVTKDVDLTTSTTQTVNAFGFNSDGLVVPTMYSEATFVIKNEGNVAFGYYVEITNFSGDNTFAGMIEVSVMADREVEFVNNEVGYELIAGSTFVADERKTLNGLSGGNTIALGSQTSFLGEVMANSATESMQAFTVKIEFISNDDNNDAKNKTAQFDIVVYAVQLT